MVPRLSSGGSARFVRSRRELNLLSADDSSFANVHHPYQLILSFTPPTLHPSQLPPTPLFSVIMYGVKATAPVASKPQVRGLATALERWQEGGKAVYGNWMSESASSSLAGELLMGSRGCLMERASSEGRARSCWSRRLLCQLD